MCVRGMCRTGSGSLNMPGSAFGRSKQTAWSTSEQTGSSAAFNSSRSLHEDVLNKWFKLICC